MAQQLKVFVSHSHEDDAFCRTLVQALRQAGADVWYDEHNMGSGRLGPTIEREVRDRPVFVVILSPAALRSRWVEDETRWAYGLLRKDSNRIILPVTASVIQEDNIWLFLQDFKRIEASGLHALPPADAAQRTLKVLGLTTGWNPPPSDTAPRLSWEGPLNYSLPKRAVFTEMPSEREKGREILDYLAARGIQLDNYIQEGRILQYSGKHAEAVVLFERATTHFPEATMAWRYMATSLRALGRTAEAEQAEQRARELRG